MKQELGLDNNVTSVILSANILCSSQEMSSVQKIHKWSFFSPLRVFHSRNGDSGDFFFI